MEKRDKIADYFTRNNIEGLKGGNFNVYKVDEFYKGNTSPMLRRDYYKISLICKGVGKLSYGGTNIAINGNAVVFGNPLVPYSWKLESEEQSGYFCMFTSDFINNNLKSDVVANSPLFKVNESPVVFLSQKSMDLLVMIFEQMFDEITSSYQNKDDLLRSYIEIIMHEAQKASPQDEDFINKSSAVRLTELFLQLLNRQFPVAAPQYMIQLKNASEFAKQLSVHTNHLNKSLKAVTGKSTTEHINEKMINEAKALLNSSSWDIAEIGYSLGFQHASNFTIFFKKHTKATPASFRSKMIDLHKY